MLYFESVKTIKMTNKITNYGFTLVEILIVIAILAVLTVSGVTIGPDILEKSRVSKTVSEVQEVQGSISLYIFDTKTYPAECRPEFPDPEDRCDVTNDPFLNSLGIPGWSGPYIPLYNLTHPWGGQISWEHGGDNGSPDGDGDGSPDYWIFLNDDRPGMGGSDNQGRIPLSALIRIDEILDDGNLATGDVRGNGTDWPNQDVAIGELAIKVSF